MKKLTQEQLNEIVRLHKLWLLDDPNGVKANLSGADLSGMGLSGVNLSWADIYRTNLLGIKK